jgi:polysaccharide transporter, PST family
MSDHYSRKLVSNFLSLSIVQGTNFLLPIIVMPYVIGRIGTAGFGVISVAHVIMIYLSSISDYGFNLTATKDISLFRGDRVKISKIFFLTLASKLLITLFCFFLLLILILFIPTVHQHLSLYLLGFLYVVGQSILVSWFFQGMEKMQYITVSTLLARIVFVLLVFIFIRQKEDNIFFLFFLGIGNIIAGLFSIYLAIRIFKLKFIQPRWSEIIFELKEGWHITVSNLSINTYLYTNIFILRIFTNDLVVGYYSVAEKIFFAIRQILGIFSQAIYPRVCQFALKSEEQVHVFFKKIYAPFLFLTMVLAFLTFSFAPQLVKLFLVNPPAIPVLLLQLLSFVPLIVCLNIPAYQLLLAFNKKKSYSGILGFGTVVNVIANLLLCPVLGAIGTVTSIIITELFITIGLNHQIFKHKLVHLLRAKPI